MGNFWINRNEKVREIKTMLESQIQQYLFEPLDDLTKKRMENHICKMLSDVWEDVEIRAEKQLV